MSKKRVNGAWVSDSPRIYNTSTDTITTLPKTIIADGQSASAVIKGNLSQTGTPTPTNPIYPSETGDKTANLTNIPDYSERLYDFYYTADKLLLSNVPAGTYTLSAVIETDGTTAYMAVGVGTTGFDADLAQTSNLPDGLKTLTFTISGNNVGKNVYVRFVRYYSPKSVLAKISDVMLNTGSTALPYEPPGYKIPISSANTTTNVYLGEVQSTRQIKKLVLTGEETWDRQTPQHTNILNLYTAVGGAMPNSEIISNIIMYSSNAGSNNDSVSNIGKINSSGTNLLIDMSLSDFSDQYAFKTYLAQQYSNGTPVTVWYIIATPETAVVNEPLRKIGNYADTVSGITIPTIAGADSFDVLTTLKPSEVSLTYHGWHEHSDEKYVGGVINKFNKDATDTNNGYVRGKYLKNTGEETVTATYSISEYIDISMYSKMTLSGFMDGASSPSLCFYDINHNYISGISYNARYTVTFDVPSQAKYIRFSYANLKIDTAMLTEGSTVPSEYHPYYEWVED